MNTSLIRLSKSCISEAEQHAVADVLSKEFLGMGGEVLKFEQGLTDFFSRPAVCVVNGTAALQLAVQATGLGEGDEVLVPSLTYVASFQAIAATGAKPVACDVEADSLVLDWKDAEKRLTSKTRAIMPVHYTGGVGNLEAIYAFAKANNLRVIEDAAHAFGSIYQKRKIGSFGDIACFSFDGIKNITSGEGGCIITSDEEVLQRIRDARLLGVEKDTEKRFSGQRSWEFDVNGQGWRYHMSNIMAAIGNEQLKRFEVFAAARQKFSKEYDRLLRNHLSIIRIEHDYDLIVPHIYVVRIKGLKNRKVLQDRLLQHNIQTGIHYQPCHTLSLFRNNATLPYPVTEAAFSQMLTLPLHPDLREGDVKRIVETLLAEVEALNIS